MTTAVPRVLLLDGDPGARVPIRQVVASLGFEVDEASTSDEALDVARQLVPHVLVADWGALPEPQDDFLDQLLAACGGFEAQVMVTCAPERADEAKPRAMLLGIGLVLQKPVDVILLRQALAGAVAVAGKQGAPPGAEEVSETPSTTAPDGRVPGIDGPPLPDLAGADLDEDEDIWGDETTNTPLDMGEIFGDDGESTQPGDHDTGKWALEVEDVPKGHHPVVAPDTPPVGPGGAASASGGGVEGLADLLEPEADVDGVESAPSVRPDQTEETDAIPAMAAVAEIESEGAEAVGQSQVGLDAEVELRRAAADGGHPSEPPAQEVVEVAKGVSVAGIVVESGDDEDDDDSMIDDGFVIDSDHPDVLDDNPVAPSVPPPSPAAPPPQPPPSPPPRSASPPTPRPLAPEEAPVDVPDEIAPGIPGSGTLSHPQFVELYVAIFREKASGALVVEREGRSRSFEFNNGRPVGLSCSHMADGLIPYLFARGDLDGDAGDAALSEAETSDADHSEILFRRQAIEPGRLVEAMGDHVADLSAETLGWHAGSYRFEVGGGGPKGPPASGIDPAAIVVNGMVANAQSKFLAALVDLPPQAVSVKVAEPLVNAKDIRLGPREARVRDLALAGAQLGEIIDRGGMTPDETRAVVRALFLLGSIGIDPTGQTVAASAPPPGAQRATVAPPRPSAPAPAASPVPPAATPRPSAPPAATPRPSAPPAATPRPSAPPAATPRPSPLPRSSRPPAGRPSAAPKAASPSPGAAGDGEMPNLPLLGLPSATDVAGPKKLATGHQLNAWEAYEAIQGGEFREAMEKIRKAIAVEPENKAYHLYLGWATFRDNADAAKLAERCLLEASRLDRHAPEPFYIMSEICSLTGQKDRAEKFEQRADRLSKAAAAADMLETSDDVELRREMSRAVKDYLTDEKRAKELKQQDKGGFLGRLLGKK